MTEPCSRASSHHLGKVQGSRSQRVFKGGLGILEWFLPPTLDADYSLSLSDCSQQFSFKNPWQGVVRFGTVGWGKSAGVCVVGSEALLHEAHEEIPVIERQVLQQGAQVFEEGAAGRQRGAHRGVRGVHPVQGGMDQEGQQDQGSEQVGRELFAVSEVVVEMVAIGLEGVVVLVAVGRRTCTPGLSQNGS
jgi:hypothetical protein